MTNTGDALAAYVELLERVGRDRSLVQGLGGNCSVKSGQRMLVKASGKSMSEARKADFFHEVRLTKLGGFEDDVSIAKTRPSIEVFLHAAIPSKYVLHVHSVAAIASSLRIPQSATLRSRVASEGIVALPYLRPGRELFQGISENSSGQTSVFLLANHGLVISAETLEELDYRLDAVEEHLWGIASEGRLSSFSELMDELESEESDRVRWHMLNNWRVTPDHVVFLGSEAAEQFLTINEFSSVVKFLEVAREVNALSTSQVEQLESFIHLARLLDPEQVYSTLSIAEANYLQSWPLEVARRKVAVEE